MVRYTYKNLIVVALIVISTISIETGWKFFLEKSARIQSRYNLEQIQVCVNDLVLRNGGNKNDNFNNKVNNDILEKALKTCARDMKVSPTGDVFAYDLTTKDFIFDPSLDCYVPGGKKMTVESECSLHYDKQRCTEALEDMDTGYDSTESSHTSWNFTKNTEYLEWKILPYQSKGFHGITRGGQEVPYQIVVAQGAQESELFHRYEGFRILLYLIAFISIILNLSLSFHRITIKK